MENPCPSSEDADKGINTDIRDCLLEVQRLDEVVEGALHLDPFGNKGETHNTCSNASGKADWHARLEHLCEFAHLHLVTPLLHKHATSQEKANARLMLPSFWDSIFLLLIKTWHLAQARQQHVQQLRDRFLESVELCREAQTGSDRAELDSVRKALKEKCGELALTQKNIEIADNHRQSIEHLLVEVEQERESETRMRTEVERRLANAKATAAFAANLRECEFHSKLVETRDALKQAQGALAEARMGLEVAELRRMQGEERSMQLERSLTACKQQLQSLLQQWSNGTTEPLLDGGMSEPSRTRSLSNSGNRLSSRTALRQPSQQLSGLCGPSQAKDDQFVPRDQPAVMKQSLPTLLTNRAPPSKIAPAGQPGNVVPGQRVVLTTMMPPGQQQLHPPPHISAPPIIGTEVSSSVVHEQARPSSVAHSPVGSCRGSPRAMRRSMGRSNGASAPLAVSKTAARQR